MLRNHASQGRRLNQPRGEGSFACAACMHLLSLALCRPYANSYCVFIIVCLCVSVCLSVYQTIFQGCGLNAERGREWAGQNAEVPSSMAGILQKWSSVSKGKDPEGRAAFLRGIGAQTQAEMDLLSKRLRCLQHEAAQERQWARLSTACDSAFPSLACNGRTDDGESDCVSSSSMRLAAALSVKK